MVEIASQITSLTMFTYSAVYSDAGQRKHQSSASLAFVRWIHRELPAQMASNAENVSIWWRHHGKNACREILHLVLGFHIRGINVYKYIHVWLQNGETE